ncbi:hypothetical protein [Candidatus Ichthyocystis sparus]|uniref:hypothetical protein n=1 Tax=Candidatus Ichthyocystis sparus TaxID=1561004 RepID=UPI000B833D9B|nr:hypothetical protein [Candidatus Ichthyocystis sparus]
MVINVIEKEKNDAAEALLLLSSCPEREPETGGALTVLSSHSEGHGDVLHMGDSSCELESQSKICPEHSYSLSELSCVGYNPSSSVDPSYSIDLSLEEVYAYALPEEIYSDFFNLRMLFRALFDSYCDKLLSSIYKNIPGLVAKIEDLVEGIIRDTFATILDGYINNILSMDAVYRFLNCPGIHLSGYTEDGFSSESSIALLKAELELLMPHCVEGVTKTVLSLANSENIRKNKKVLLTDDLVSVISSSISGTFYKCVPMFLKLITSCEFLKMVFFKKVPGFDRKIFSPLAQRILNLNRKFFCELSILENRYLVSMVLGDIKKIPETVKLFDSYEKSLRNMVCDDVFFALNTSDDVVLPLEDCEPVIEGVGAYLRDEASLRMTSRSGIFSEKFQVGFWESDASSGGGDDFYKSLDNVILNSPNYIGGGFVYYLMRIFTPVCVSVARDVIKILVSSVGSEFGSLSHFRLESGVRFGMFDLIFSVLLGMDLLREVDGKLRGVSLSIGMNICELFYDILPDNLIETAKEAVIGAFTVKVLKDFFPKRISVLDSKGKSVSMTLTEAKIKLMFESCASIFGGKIRSVVMVKDFLSFYIRNTLFKEFGKFCVAVSNVDISKISAVKLDLVYKIVCKSDRLNYMNSAFPRTSGFFMSGKGTNLNLSSDKFEVAEFMMWLREEIKLVVTKPVLVLSPDGVVSELGESLENLLKEIASSLMDECLSVARDVIRVDKNLITVDKSMKHRRKKAEEELKE